MNKYKNDFIKVLLNIVLHVGLIAIFDLIFAITNPALRLPSRTLVITTLSFIVFFQFTSKIYDGFQIGEEKSKPIIYNMGMAVIFATLGTYITLMIMNTNPNNNAMLRFEDLDKLLITILSQVVFLIVLTYLGNDLYFHFNEPKKVLVLNNNYPSAPNVLQYLNKYKKQFHTPDVVAEFDCDNKDALSQYDMYVLLNSDQVTIDKFIRFGFENEKEVYFNAEFSNVMVPTESAYFSDILMIRYVDKPMSLLGQFSKRLIDIIVSIIGIVLTSPFMIIIAICIKMEDKGPVFFRQERLTKDGRVFKVYKFRSMKMNAGDRPATENDDRITKTGKIIRRLRLDELPQFINILLNDMSVVGPRPESVSQATHIMSELPEFKYRLKVKGGLTGQAQIYGKYNTNPLQKLIHDIDYIENQSTWNDIKLIFLTLTVFFKKDSTEGFTEEDIDQMK